MPTPWARFSLPGDELAYARGDTAEFTKTLREIFGPLVERVRELPEGRLAWVMAEVPGEGSLSAFFRSLEKRLTPAGSLWVVLPKKPFAKELSFPYSWIDVQKAGLAAGLVDNKIAAFSKRLTSIRFVVPVARRNTRGEQRETRNGKRETGNGDDSVIGIRKRRGSETAPGCPTSRAPDSPMNRSPD